VRSRRLEVLEDEQAVAERAAELARELSRQVIASRGVFAMALSGGSTPRLFHRALSRMDGIEWTKIHVFYSDERAVPPDHEHSNHRMATETLTAPIPRANVHRIDADDGDTARAARAYERELLSIAPDGAIDLVLLGMGADGHTASLFPGREPAEDALVVAANAPPESPVERRVTFSHRALERAKTVMVLVTGAAKAARLAEILGDGDVDLPLGRVLDHRSSDTVILIDEAAASLLPKEK
jgi:6-phosphogluconolactonase